MCIPCSFYFFLENRWRGNGAWLNIDFQERGQYSSLATTLHDGKLSVKPAAHRAGVNHLCFRAPHGFRFGIEPKRDYVQL
jgi:hypothetical protein